MPLYRGLKKGTSETPPPLDPTRRVARADGKPRPGSSPAAAAVAAATAAPVVATDALTNPVVGWLVIIAGPGRGTVLPLGYGVNDIGRGVGAKVRLDFGDAAVALENQAAIIYTARSRHFYLQSVAAETLLNGEPASKSLELTNGDLLQLGQTRLRFVPLCGTGFDWRDNN
jgi:hypothetical protein